MLSFLRGDSKVNHTVPQGNTKIHPSIFNALQSSLHTGELSGTQTATCTPAQPGKESETLGWASPFSLRKGQSISHLSRSKTEEHLGKSSRKCGPCETCQYLNYTTYSFLWCCTDLTCICSPLVLHDYRITLCVLCFWHPFKKKNPSEQSYYTSVLLWLLPKTGCGSIYVLARFT